METQRKDVKNLLYGRRLLMMMISVLTRDSCVVTASCRITVHFSVHVRVAFSRISV